MPGKKGNNKQKDNEEGGNFKFDFGNKEAVNALMPLLQKKVNNLVGTSSGYLETLPLSVQRRVKALRKLQKEHATLEDQFRKEREELENKYNLLKNPLYHKRHEIVTGHREPTDDELHHEEEKKEEGQTEKDTKKEVPTGEDIKGIPEFWLQALKHHDEFMDLITPEDEDALKHLVDIRCVSVPNEEKKTPSFQLEFHFGPNEYFDDAVITKTYLLSEDPDMNEVMFENSTSSEIKWKTGKNLTKKIVTKQQKIGGGNRRGKKGKGGQVQTRTIQVEEDVPSFFHFFTPIEPPEDMDDEDEDMDPMERLQEMLSEDYEVGLSVKTGLIPNALLWFAGEIPTYGGGMYDDEDEDDEEGEDEEYNSEDDDDFQPVPENSSGQPQPECKQQ